MIIPALLFVYIVLLCPIVRISVVANYRYRSDVEAHDDLAGWIASLRESRAADLSLLQRRLEARLSQAEGSVSASVASSDCTAGSMRGVA